MKYALHFGLDKPSYSIDNDSMIANSCVANSAYYHELSIMKGFESRHFPNEKATSYRLLRNLRACSKKMKAGDLLFLTYCGHGKSIAARSEFDGSSEVLILFDRIFLDQELKRCLNWFDKGIYIFIVTNSCQNGTLFKKKYTQIKKASLQDKVNNMTNGNKTDDTYDNDDDELQIEYISGHQYANYLNAIKYYLRKVKDLKHPIIHIASSSDSELSKDSKKEGKLSEFTKTFKKIIDDGFHGSYQDFFEILYRNLNNPSPFLEINSDCKNIDTFLNTSIFNKPNN